MFLHFLCILSLVMPKSQMVISKQGEKNSPVLAKNTGLFEMLNALQNVLRLK